MGAAGFEEVNAGFGPKIDRSAAEAGARNLLLNCAGLCAGQSVLIVCEDPALGWYDAAAPEMVSNMASAMGAQVDVARVGGPEIDLSPEICRASEAADLTIFFARIGDRDRFCVGRRANLSVVSYARTIGDLASDFGTRPHGEMQTLKNGVDAKLFSAPVIDVTCPLGTRLTGRPVHNQNSPVDVSVLRFPLSVPAPVPAAAFSGQVALAGCVAPTGSQSYQPAAIAIPDVVLAEIRNGRIASFDGDSETVSKLERHHEHVARLFDLDPWIVHSWHAGLHDGCSSEGPMISDPDLWANSVFGSPRWLHFHTCGDYAPGEICWMVSDPTIRVDGTQIWDRGVLYPPQLDGLGG